MRMIETWESTPYYDEKLKPIATIQSGDTIVMHSPDCWANKLVDESVTKTELLASGLEMNPCAGPVYVEGAMPGDTLKIYIENVEVEGDCGRLALIANEFAANLGDYFDRPDETVVVPIREGYAYFHHKFKVKINPMVGVLAVTPAGERVGTLWPGKFCGNHDSKLVTRGTTMYIPVQVPGALLIAGDCHALQGNGEVLASLEVASKLTLKVEVIKNRCEEWPVLETDDRWYVFTFAGSIDEANELALRAMAEFLKKRGIHTMREWVSMFGVVGDLEINEIPDPLLGSRFSMPKAIMNGLAF